MDLWAACKGATAPVRLEGELIRMVESQEQIATTALVDSLAEQALIEDMLETSKPVTPSHAAGLHYLLATPFRYPPLQYGSRFGSRYEPSLFYGSLDLSAALAETAYYRFVFWSGLATPPRAGRLVTEHTAFGAAYWTDQGLRLHAEPGDRFSNKLMNRENYSATQRLGQARREAGIEAFEYLSARDPRQGRNIGIFTGAVFPIGRPSWQDAWLCDTREGEVSLYSKSHGVWSFRRDQFIVDGRFPAPST